MGLRHTTIAGVAACALVVAALAGDVTRPQRHLTSGPSRPTPAPLSNHTGSPATPGGSPGAGTPVPAGRDAIKRVDFGTLAWSDVQKGVSLPLVAGKATVGDRGYAVDPAITFADADGDGDTDAFVRLTVTEAGKASTHAYIWLWDARTQEPVQVPDIVNIYGECGNVFTTAQPDPLQGFRLTESWHDPNDGDCAPAHAFTRTVTVGDDRRLFQTSPYFGYGGYCNATAPKPEVRWEEITVHTHPDGGSPVVVTDTSVVYVEMPGHELRTWPKGWVQVAWYAPEQEKKKEFWGTCGFAKLN